MVRVERDAGFWEAVAAHPEVAPHITLGQTASLGTFVAHPLVTPLAAEHGGFLFVRLDPLGRVLELHTLFTPEGWGREVNQAAKAAFNHVFATCQIVTTYEVRGNRRSQPPRSFGFVRAADFAPTPYGADFATWILTKDAWEASPAARRFATCL